MPNHIGLWIYEVEAMQEDLEITTGYDLQTGLIH
jgi:hypothetical protein